MSTTRRPCERLPVEESVIVEIALELGGRIELALSPNDAFRFCAERRESMRPEQRALFDAAKDCLTVGTTGNRAQEKDAALRLALERLEVCNHEGEEDEAIATILRALGEPEKPKAPKGQMFLVKLKEEVWHTVKVRAETEDDAIEQAQIALDHGAADETNSEGVAETFVTCANEVPDVVRAVLAAFEPSAGPD